MSEPVVTVSRTAVPGVEGTFFQADCDDCGWHTRATIPGSVVKTWAGVHRDTCPAHHGRWGE